MLLQPRKTKHRKSHTGVIRGKAGRGQRVCFGDYGLQAVGASRLRASTIEAGRRAITHSVKRQGKVFVNVFPAVPVSKRPAETRMGKGKGPVEYWIGRVKPGRILYEIMGVGRDGAFAALKRAADKMPMKTRIVTKRIL